MQDFIEATRTIPAKLLIWLIIVSGFYCPASYSNGWEHTSIDFDVLVLALNDANPNVRRRAAESMGFRQQPEATDALLARLKTNEPVARVRQEIYGALGRLGESSALDAFRDCLTNETAIALRAQCTGALGNIDTRAAEQLALQSIGDENLQVRLRAIASLGSFASAATVKALIDLLKDSNDSIKNTALLSLGRTRSVAATAVLADLLKRSTKPEQIIVLLRSLTLLADADAIDVIQTVYRQSADERIKQYALVAMASTRAKGSESYFLDALSSEDHASRILGLAALRKLGNPDKVAVIAEHALSDSSDLFSLDSVRLLGEPVSTIASLELLNEYLKTIIHLNPKAGQSVYLQATRPVTIARSSSAALKVAEGFYTARWQSIYGLGYTGTEKAAERVAAALKDPDSRIRAVATRSMGVLGNSNYFDLIEEMLRDDAAEVRWIAARVLGRSKITESSNALMQSLNDNHAQVRLESVIALGYLNALAAKPKLSQLAAGDPDRRVREAAVYAASLIE